jgi:hypothetical protein
VRAELAKNPTYFDQLLSRLKVDHKSHIKEIYDKYKTYLPCGEYLALLEAERDIQRK